MPNSPDEDDDYEFLKRRDAALKRAQSRMDTSDKEKKKQQRDAEYELSSRTLTETHLSNRLDQLIRSKTVQKKQQQQLIHKYAFKKDKYPTRSTTANATPTAASSSSQPPPEQQQPQQLTDEIEIVERIAGDEWTETEITAFFNALRRYTKRDPHSIAAKIGGTKTALDVQRYIANLEVMSAEYKQRERKVFLPKKAEIEQQQEEDEDIEQQQHEHQTNNNNNNGVIDTEALQEPQHEEEGDAADDHNDDGTDGQQPLCLDDEHTASLIKRFDPVTMFTLYRNSNDKTVTLDAASADLFLTELVHFVKTVLRSALVFCQRRTRHRNETIMEDIDVAQALAFLGITTEGGRKIKVEREKQQQQQESDEDDIEYDQEGVKAMQIIEQDELEEESDLNNNGGGSSDGQQLVLGDHTDDTEECELDVDGEYISSTYKMLQQRQQQQPASPVSSSTLKRGIVKSPPVATPGKNGPESPHHPLADVGLSLLQSFESLSQSKAKAYNKGVVARSSRCGVAQKSPPQKAASQLSDVADMEEQQRQRRPPPQQQQAETIEDNEDDVDESPFSFRNILLARSQQQLTQEGMEDEDEEESEGLADSKKKRGNDDGESEENGDRDNAAGDSDNDDEDAEYMRLLMARRAELAAQLSQRMADEEEEGEDEQHEITQEHANNEKETEDAGGSAQGGEAEEIEEDVSDFRRMLLARQQAMQQQQQEDGEEEDDDEANNNNNNTKSNKKRAHDSSEEDQDEEVQESASGVSDDDEHNSGSKHRTRANNKKARK